MQFTAKQLNALISRVGFTEAVEKPLYIRIKSQLGSNIAPTYSNVLKLNVTPYVIDMSVGFILDSNQSETGATLASPASDGIYKGFMGAAGSTICTLNRVFTIQAKKRMTNMGTRQFVTIITAVASMNRFRTFRNWSTTPATEPDRSPRMDFASSMTAVLSPVPSVISPVRFSLTALADSTVISMDLL